MELAATYAKRLFVYPRTATRIAIEVGRLMDRVPHSQRETEFRATPSRFANSA
jgi:hypothetical protein